MNQEEKVIWEAEFNPAVTTYWLMGGSLAFLVSIIGIPLLPVALWYDPWHWDFLLPLNLPILF